MSWKKERTSFVPASMKAMTSGPQAFRHAWGSGPQLFLQAAWSSMSFRSAPYEASMKRSFEARSGDSQTSVIVARPPTRLRRCSNALKPGLSRGSSSMTSPRTSSLRAYDQQPAMIASARPTTRNGFRSPKATIANTSLLMPERAVLTAASIHP